MFDVLAMRRHIVKHHCKMVVYDKETGAMVLDVYLERVHYGVGNALVAVNAEGIVFTIVTTSREWSDALYRQVQVEVQHRYNLDSVVWKQDASVGLSRSGGPVIPELELSTGRTE